LDSSEWEQALLSWLLVIRKLAVYGRWISVGLSGAQPDAHPADCLRASGIPKPANAFDGVNIKRDKAGRLPAA
jgi:hypothetical protein